MLNQVLKVSSGTCKQSVEVLSKSVTFLDFHLSQGSVATYCRWGGNLCDMYIENFLMNHLVREFWKSVHNCQSYYQTSNGLLFWDMVYTSRYCQTKLTAKYNRPDNGASTQKHLLVHLQLKTVTERKSEITSSAQTQMTDNWLFIASPFTSTEAVSVV